MQVSEGVWGGSDAGMHHRHLYIARRALPLLLRRQARLWPDMPEALGQQPEPQLVQEQLPQPPPPEEEGPPLDRWWGGAGAPLVGV